MDISSFLCELFCFLFVQKRPVDNSFYVKTCNENPKKTRWWYHGESLRKMGIEAIGSVLRRNGLRCLFMWRGKKKMIRG